MSFKPKNSNNSGGTGEQRNFPVPKAGSRRARVSLIVDLGIQERADLWEKDGKVVNEGTDGATCKPQKPVQQVAVFADLVNDTVDYGGEVGKAHYRLMLNGTFKGVLKGIPFAASPPKDANGKTIPNKKWGFHSGNMLHKLAKAVGKPEVIEDMDINELLGEQFMALVEVNETDSGKQDDDGNEIVYKNVNFKGPSMVAAVETDKLDEDGNPIEEVPTFAALKTEAKCITFNNATKEDIKVIRVNLIKQIKLAKDYAGSEMQKAIEAFEAEKESKSDAPAKDAPAEGKTAPAKEKKAPAPKRPVEADPADEDSPF